MPSYLSTAGNRRFRDAITSAIDEYNNSDSRMAKSRVVQRIVEEIKRDGGRFLKRDRSSGSWIELDTKSSRDKVGHAIRDAANLIEARKQKQSSSSSNKPSKRMSGSSSTGMMGGGCGSVSSAYISQSSRFEEGKMSMPSHHFALRDATTELDYDTDDICFENDLSESGRHYHHQHLRQEQPLHLQLEPRPLPEMPMPPVMETRAVVQEEDPFLRHINSVLGPPQETHDPLRDYLDSFGR